MSHLLVILALAAGFSAGPPDRGQELRDAAQTGDLARVKALLEAGVPVDSPERHNQTPLWYAANKGHAEVAALLLERGADINARETFFGTTPLQSALFGEHMALALTLIQKGGGPADDALRVAVRRGDLELARAALATGKVGPLELKAAQRMAESDPNMKALLAEAKAQPQKRSPYALAPDKLKRYAGKYRIGDKLEAEVAVKDGGLVMTSPGQPDLVVKPVEMDRFETASGDTAVIFAGRAGTIEWIVVNRDGEMAQGTVWVPDPQPMKVASGGPAGPAAIRGAARPWPQFRGTSASGIADGQGVPSTWSVAKKENILFKTPIPGIALSSPILWEQRLFVTTTISSSGDATFKTGLYGDPASVDDTSEHSFRLYALDARTGKIEWEREIFRGKPTVRRHLKSSLANATPATDGKTVVVLFGAVGALAAFDMQGTKLWQRDVGVLDCNDPSSGLAEWGHASSPILWNDLILVQADRRKDSFLAAYKLATGEEAWKVARDETSTWTTPNILRGPAGDELVTNGRTIRAYDPRTGSLLWTLGPNSEVIVATPVVGDGHAYITAGYPPVRPIYAVRAGSRGDLSLPEGKTASDAIAWSHARGGTYIPTPILYQGHFYTVNNNGILSCYKAGTGERLYQTRLGESGASFSASPVAADGRIYFPSETGEVYVLRAGPEYELLATNTMDEVVMASPAASDGLLVVRTLGHVVGIASPGPAASR